ncbi:MAG: hypothetical protein NC310_07730 [Roseburia sp.]|nr:hypothetical protein [Anaeroplasma bactoclasticum]MCM1196938.1 hypothetical protein [Roseburia sp.]MCM1557473.1 hypothetical protein [Anaeroplasma bactoclasticum]
MMTIQIAHINISIDFKFETEFRGLLSYQTNEQASYFIKSHMDNIPIIKGKPTRRTEFYDLYEMDNKIIQIQKSNAQIIGAIVYQNHNMDLYLQKKDFPTEYLLSQYALLYILNQKKNALFIHASSIVYHSKGILFSAKSGTGKSTHAKLWRTYTDAQPINDDKNIIVFENNQLFLYSNPWSGKHQIHQNINAPLSAIIFLYQSKTNEIRQIEPREAMRLLLGQIAQPKKDSLDSWNTIVDKILELPIYYYGCNMEKEAVTVLKNRLEMDLCL